MSEASITDIELVMPIEEALALAKGYALPVEEAPDGGWLADDWVDVLAVDETLKLDVRYATAANFMGSAVYEVAGAVLQRAVAEDLSRVHSELKQRGLGLVVFDGYRPYYVTVAMWLAVPEPLRDSYLAKPARGSIHNRGAAVDVGLFDVATGEAVSLPSDYDEFTERSGVGYTGGPADRLAQRDLLISVMADHGFRVYREEWWHFNHPDARRYRFGNVALKDVLADRDKR